MDKFETVLMRMGEHGVQALLENWERFSGLRVSGAMSLEDRWDRFLRATDSVVARAA